MTWVSPLPSIATVHDVYPFAAPAEDLRKRRNEQIPFRTTASHARLIITDSNFSKSEITKHLLVRQEQVRVVHLGVDAQLLSATSRFASTELHVAGGCIAVRAVRRGKRATQRPGDVEAAMHLLPDALRMTTGLVIAGKPGPALAARGRLDSARRQGRQARVLRFERADVNADACDRRSQ